MRPALDRDDEGFWPEEHPRFAFVAHEVGHPRGGASAIARAALEGCVSNPTPEAIVDAVVAADARVRTECARGQGATFAACIVHPGASVATVVHLGDCRVHTFRDAAITYVSRDHSMWNAFVDSMGERDDMKEEWKRIIVRGLGMVSARADVEPRVLSCTARDVVVLTTSDVHRRVSTDELRHAVYLHEHDPSAAERVIATLAKRRGHHPVPPGVRVIAIATASEPAAEPTLAND